jgi:hypothetical protein
MLIFSIVCLLLLLKNAENFQLTKNQILSHLGKQPSPLNAPTSIARQSHTCLVDCDFTLSFTEPLILPDNCNPLETSDACEMIITLDYKIQTISLYSYASAESLTIGNTTYDSATLHLAYFEFNDSSIFHIFDYTCAAGNYCEWEYMQQIIPKLILFNYQPLYNSLLPKLFNSNGHPGLTQCYRDTDLVNCSSGTCEYYQSADNNYQLEITRDCSFFQTSSVESGLARYFPGPAIHDYDVVGFTCDIDQCNDQSNENEIRQIISSNGNEYITTISYSSEISSSTGNEYSTTISYSSGIKLQWISFSLYFLNFILIKYFK